MPDRITLEEFGKKIKAKYPQYENLSDTDIANKVIAKYPQYKDSIKPGTPVAPTPPSVTQDRGFFDPLSAEERQGIEAHLGKVLGPVVEGVGNAAMGALSGAGSLVFHPLSTVYSSAQTAADALNQLFPDVGLNPQQKAAKEASLSRLKDQWESIKDNPDYAIGNLFGAIEGGKVVGEAVGPLKRKLLDTVESARKGTQTLVGAGERTVKSRVATEADDAAQKREATLASNKKADEETLENRGKVDKARLEIMRDNKAAAAKNQAERTQAAMENKEALRQQENRIQTQGKMDEASSELRARIETAREKALKIGNEKYNTLNPKLNQYSADPELMPAALIDSLEKIKGTSTEPAILKDIGHKLQLGEVPTYEDLQGYYSELGNEISKGTLPGDLYTAYDTLHEAIGEEMKRIAGEHGEGAALKDSRDYWRRMKRTFGKPLTWGDNATAVIKGLIPDFLTKDIQANRLRLLASYDPEIAKVADHIRNLDKGLSRLPKEAPVRDVVKVPPSPPEPKPLPQYIVPNPTKPVEVPEVNTQAIRVKLLEKWTSGESSLNKWQVRALLSGGIGSVVGLLVGHGAGLEAAGIVSASTYALGPSVVANILERPAVVEWLTRPPAGELETLRKLPNADRIKIEDGLQKVAAQAQKQGIKVSPAVLSVIGATGVVPKGPKTRELESLRDGLAVGTGSPSGDQQ